MKTYVADVMIGIGVLVTAPALAGVCCMLVWGHAPREPAIGMVAVGFVLTIAGLVPRLDDEQGALAGRAEALARARSLSQQLGVDHAATEPIGTAPEDSLDGPRRHRQTVLEEAAAGPAGTPTPH